MGEVKAAFHVDEPLQIVLQVLKHQIEATSLVVFLARYSKLSFDNLRFEARIVSSLTMFLWSSTFRYLISRSAVIGNYHRNS